MQKLRLVVYKNQNQNAKINWLSYKLNSKIWTVMVLYHIQDETSDKLQAVFPTLEIFSNLNKNALMLYLECKPLCVEVFDQ